MSLLHRFALYLPDSTASRHALLRSLQLYVYVYLLVTNAMTVHTLLTSSSANADTPHVLIGILLLDLLGLHVILALAQDTYTWIDGVLDILLLVMIYFILQSIIICNINFYLAITVISCLLPTRSIKILIFGAIAANLLATWSVQQAPMHVWMQHAEILNAQAWTFFLVNLVGLPYIGVLIHTQTRLLKKREEDMAIMQQAHYDLHRSRTRLTVAEKMASLGRLTGSIGHEMNNYLGGLNNALEMMELQLAQMDNHQHGFAKLQQWLSLAKKANGKSLDFIRSLKSQTRHMASDAAEEFPVQRSLGEVVQLLHHECLRHGCELHTNFAATEAVLYGEPGKLSQVLMNLIKNAIEAYPLESATASRPIWVTARADEHALQITIADHGCGIPEQQLPHIFEYLYTTKTAGGGSGQGLAIVHEIITGHFGGSIDVASDVGVGTTFTLTFPTRTVDDLARELAVC